MKSKPKLHQRYYNSEGHIVPSVTTIIGNNLGWNKNILIAWARREASQGNDPDAIKRGAGSSGTLAHSMIEHAIRHEIDYSYTEQADYSNYTHNQIAEATNAFKAWLQFTNDYGPKYLQAEIQLVSNKYNYGGTIDAIAKIKGKLYMLDWKTSNGVYPEMKVQLASYRQLYKENIGGVPKLLLVRFDKGGKGYEVHNVTNISKYWRVFQYCLKLEQLRKEVK